MPFPLRGALRQRPIRSRLGTRLLRPAGAPPIGIVPRTPTVAENSSATTVTGTLPTDRQTGDYVIAHFAMTSTVAQFTGPGGSWTQLVAPTDDGVGQIVAVYGMFDPGSAPVGTTSGAAGRQTCLMQAYGRVDQTTPIDVAAATPTVGTMPITVPQVTTVTAGARLIAGAVGNFSTGAWDTPPGMNMVVTHTSGVGRGAAIADEVRATAGATGSRQWSSSAGALVAAGYLFALRPATQPTVREWLSAEGSGANVSVTTGAGTLSGDTILVWHANDFNTAANLTGPTSGSWTLVGTGDSGNTGATAGSHVKAWSGTATAGAQTITVAPSVSGEEHGLVVAVMQGAVTVDGTAAGNGSQTTVTSLTANAVTPTGNADLFFTAASTDGNGSVVTAVDSPPTQTRQAFVRDTTFGFGLGVASEALTASGSTGTRTWTGAPAGRWSTLSFTVKAAAGGGGGSTNANAESPTATGAASDVSVTVTVAAEQPQTTGSAGDATAAAGANAEQPAATGVANNAAADIAANAEQPAAIGAGQDPTPAVGANAEQPSAVGQAFDATVSTVNATNANAESPSAVGVAGDATAALTVNAEQPVAAGSAADAQSSVAVAAGQPVAAGVAGDAGSSASANAQAPSATGAALDATVALTIGAEQPTATGQAFDASVNAAGNVSANAEAALGTGAGFDAAADLAVPAGQPGGTGSAADASGAVGANAEAPSAAGIAQDAGTALTVPAGQPVATGQAFDAAVVVSFAAFPEVAAGTGSAFDPGTAVTFTAGAAVAAGQALDAGQQVGPVPAAPSASGAAFDATVAVTIGAEAATAVGAAFSAAVTFDLTPVVLGDPKVTGDTVPAGVTGDRITASVIGDRIPAGVS